VRNGGILYWEAKVYNMLKRWRGWRRRRNLTTFNDALQLHQFQCGQWNGGYDEYRMIIEEGDRHVLFKVCAFSWKDDIKKGV
jgi:hypothetical protein